MENSFLPKFGQKELKDFLQFFSKIAFPRSMQNDESSFNSRLSIANTWSGKILVLKLLPKIFLTNQIAVFFNV